MQRQRGELVPIGDALSGMDGPVTAPRKTTPQERQSFTVADQVHQNVLLCTEAAAEGLNFQFCGALINYDMPWNPMRVEQRIGGSATLGMGSGFQQRTESHAAA